MNRHALPPLRRLNLAVTGLMGVTFILVSFSNLLAADPLANASQQEPDVFDLSDDAKQILFPLFSAISQASVSRTTVELSAETIVNGEVVETQTSTYQIASRAPDHFTIYLKEPEQRTRIYNDKEQLSIALAPDAYLRLTAPVTIATAVDELPIPMGPYPEPVLALSMAGFDPAITFIGGMKSVVLADHAPFRGKTPASHLKGVQDDLVTWDLWVTQERVPRPLRLIVDLTAMLRGSRQVDLPPGFQHQLRFDFLSWRITGEVPDTLFRYDPPENAKQYSSVEAYHQSIAGVVDAHPLLGKPMPSFAGVTLDNRSITSSDLKDKVVVLDFWSTWCDPCVAAMPTLERVTKRYADKDVVFYAVNVGETAGKVRGFLKEQRWDVNVMVDPQAKIAAAFQADAIPQRIIIGKNGIIESVHVGFHGEEALEQQLTDELDVLYQGGRIASATPE